MIYLLFSIAMLSLATGGVFSTLWLRLRTHQSQLMNLENRISQIEVSLQEVTVNQGASPNDFRARLEQAEITSRIHGKEDIYGLPPRYQYVIRLVNQGLTSEQLAGILKVSQYEAEQLVSLAQIALAQKESEKTGC